MVEVVLGSHQFGGLPIRVLFTFCNRPASRHRLPCLVRSCFVLRRPPRGLNQVHPKGQCRQEHLPSKRFTPPTKVSRSAFALFWIPGSRRGQRLSLNIGAVAWTAFLALVNRPTFHGALSYLVNAFEERGCIEWIFPHQSSGHCEFVKGLIAFIRTEEPLLRLKRAKEPSTVVRRSGLMPIGSRARMRCRSWGFQMAMARTCRPRCSTKQRARWR